MTSSLFLMAFLAAMLLYVVVEASLSVLNLRYGAAHSEHVPTFARSHVDADSFMKACSYTRARGQFGLFSLGYGGLFLLIFLLCGGFGAVDNRLFSLGLSPYLHGVLYVLCVGLIFSVVDLPISLYSTFVIEERFGFNKSTLWLWCLDTLKGVLLSALIMTPVLLGLFWFMGQSGRWWWLYAFVFLAFLQFVFMLLMPIWILPLFNKFTPLPEGDLKDRILSLCEKASYRIAGIFLMDGSKRSAHANAFFTGFGATKRIVLFDTLVSQLAPEETAAVLAHEMGHALHGHIKKSVALSLFAALVGLLALDWLMAQPGLYGAFGFSRPSLHAALVIFLFASSPFTYFLTPLFSMLSRRFEYQADRFACSLTGTPDDLTNGLLRLSKNSLSNLTPHPWYSFFHYSHPTLGERIAAMESFAAKGE